MGLIVFGIKSFVQQALPAAAGCAAAIVLGAGAHAGAKWAGKEIKKHTNEKAKS